MKHGEWRPDPLSAPEKNAPGPGPSPPFPAPSAWRAWWYLIWLSWQRQARAHLLVWIAVGLLAFVSFLIFINTQAGRWSMAYWRFPRGGPTYDQHLFNLESAGHLPWDAMVTAGHQAYWGAAWTVLHERSGFFVYSRWVVFSIFTGFLLPLWTITFASEGLGREREGGNLLWVLTRPLSRPAIFLGKFVALVPWCLLFTLGGFWLMCWLAGPPGRLAFALYWPATLVGTVAFAALFHALAAWLRRPSVAAILYTLFLETIAGNLPGNLKRLSLSFYTRCLMFDWAHDFGIQPERPHIYLPVSGVTAWWVLTCATLVFLGVGLMVFSRKEYGDNG